MQIKIKKSKPNANQLASYTSTTELPMYHVTRANANNYRGKCMMPLDTGTRTAGSNSESYPFIQEWHKLKPSLEEKKCTFLISNYLLCTMWHTGLLPYVPVT
jgi:hypothetical protein